MSKDRLLRFRKGLYSSTVAAPAAAGGETKFVEGAAVMEGRVSVHPSGFGFVSVPGLASDVFLPPEQLSWVMDGDEVRVKSQSMRDGRTEGQVLEVTHHAHKFTVGTFFHEHNQGFVKVRSRGGGDVSVAEEDRGGAQDGQWVVCEITRYPDPGRNARGRVIRVLGDEVNVRLLSEAALFEFSIPHEWPDGIDAELRDFPDMADGVAAGVREDLRELPLVTIDGEDARDFDDAVYAEKAHGGWRLLVAIADVSEYVAAGGALDDEALRRGTSVYFPQRVVPMLPEVLSNDLCSLRPDEERLSLVCDMRVSSQGVVTASRFYSALICSRARLTYDEVYEYMREDGASSPPPALRDSLESLAGVFRALYAARIKRGAIDLDIPEAGFVFGDNGRADSITPQLRNDAHRLIEECMLAANCCAAEFMRDNAPAAIYRVHDRPLPDKVEELREFLLGFGVHLSGGATPSAEDFSQLPMHPGLEARQLLCIQIVILRSLAQARYTGNNVGHFALASDNYTHFTSPIRRYPDLLVHRIIKALVAGAAPSAQLADGTHLESLAQHCSMTERRAEQACRDVIQRLKVQYMEQKVGASFRGVITGVTGFGLFVELEGVLVSGLVHISAIGDDYYHYDQERHQLEGERNGRCYKLGDALEVEVVGVSMERGRIDLQLPGAGGRGHRRWARPRKNSWRAPRRS